MPDKRDCPYTMDQAMDLVSAEIDRKDTPVPSAGWRGGHTNQSLRVYTSTISALSREAMDACRGAGDMIEIGTDFGLGTFAMLLAMYRFSSRKIITVDVRKESQDSTAKRAEKLGVDLKRILFVHGTSDEVEKQDLGKDFAFAYIDGGHTFENCFGDLLTVAPRMHTYGLILCHDVHYTPPGKPEGNGVRKAIKQFVKDCPEWVAMRVNGFGLLGRRLP